MSIEAEQIMRERFGKDNVIALATEENGVPYVRYVNAYYENDCFYVITYALSKTMPKRGKVLLVQGNRITLQKGWNPL